MLSGGVCRSEGLAAIHLQLLSWPALPGEAAGVHKHAILSRLKNRPRVPLLKVFAHSAGEGAAVR